MNKARLTLAMLFAIMLGSIAACSGAPEQPPLAGARIGGPFTLTDQTGARVSDAQFAGRYRLIYFGYSWCPDVCPVDLANLMKGLRQVEANDPALGAKIQPIFISVDPARDTPPVLKAYVAAFHPRLIGLTGSPAEVAAVAKTFAIYYMRGEDRPGGGYLVDHARQAMLFGPSGEPLALIPQEQGADVIAQEIKRWAH